jgi:hypothetical protein
MTAALTATGADGAVNSATTLTATAGNATELQAITSASASRVFSAVVRRRTGTGTVQITQDNGSTWTTITLTTSFQRFTTPNQTLTNPTVGFRIVTSGDAIDVDFTQAELGSVATSPIVTTAGTASRIMDVTSQTSASSLIGQTQGTIFAEFDYIQNTAERRIVSITDGTATNRLIIWPLNNILYFTANTGTSTVLLNPIPTGISKVAVNYNISGGNTVIRASVNGGAIVTATQVATPVNLSRIDLGNRQDSTMSFNGRLRAFALFPTILADATLQALTTP